MKHILQFIIAICIISISITPAKAQLADGSIAPDWTMSDLEGESHNLQSYLDQGMSVILDFSAVWCPPCWSYHNAGILEEIYTLYGPVTGDGTVMVFYIEGDQGSSGQLNGAGAGTLGDWVTGTDYPFITTVFPNSAQISSDYNINYFPTLYTVCPDGIITETGQISFQEHMDFVQIDCAEIVGTNNAYAQAYLGSDTYCSSASPSFRIVNVGTENMTSATLKVMVDGTLGETIDWTGNLASQEFETVQFSEIDGSESLNLEFIIEDVNGLADDDMNDNSFLQTVASAPKPETNDILIELTTDQYGVEVYWAVVDDAGTIVAEGGNTNVGLTNYSTGQIPAGTADSYANNQFYSIPVTLPTETCYEVFLVDGYGDGMSGTTDSYFKVIDPSNSVELYHIEGADYGGIIDSPLDANPEILAPQANFTYTVSDLELQVTDNSANAALWAWSFGDGDSSNDQAPGPHTYAASGDYEVCLTVTNSAGSNQLCQTITVSAPSGVKDIAALDAISVYPNPASDAATISLSLNSTAQITVELTNTSGQVVFTETSLFSSASESVVINTADLSTGTYFVNIRTEDGIATEKLVVTQ